MAYDEAKEKAAMAEYTKDFAFCQDCERQVRREEARAQCWQRAIDSDEYIRCHICLKARQMHLQPLSDRLAGREQ